MKSATLGQRHLGSFACSSVHISEEAANATRAVPYGILMSIGSCWLFGWILVIVMAACIDTNLENVLGSPFGQPMAQVSRSRGAGEKAN